MVKLDLIPFLEKGSKKFETCMLTKITRNLLTNAEGATNILELIHSDVGDPHSLPAQGGKKYYITFINDYSRYYYVFFFQVLWKKF